MLLAGAALLVSWIPSLFLYFWLKNKISDSQRYKDACRLALKEGLLCVVPVFFGSMLSNLAIAFLIKDHSSLLYIAIYNFVVLALVEEACKMHGLYRVKKKAGYPFTTLENTALMSIVGTFFGLAESIVYALNTSPIHMLVRGIFIMHAGYGMLMGNLIGKGEEKGKKSYILYALVIPVFLHGLYDFSLAEELNGLNDIFIFLPFLLVLIDVITVIYFINWMRKERIRIKASQIEEAIPDPEE